MHAAAGGVGLLLVQMIKARGGYVVATTSSEEKMELARGAGADETIGYDGFGDRLRELGGAHVIYDAIGATTFEDGHGRAAGARDDGALRDGQPARRRRTTRRSCRRSRSTSRARACPAYTATREELLSRAGDVLGWIADGSLDVRIGERYPLEDARRAHEDLEARRSTGKLILLP